MADNRHFATRPAIVETGESVARRSRARCGPNVLSRGLLGTRHRGKQRVARGATNEPLDTSAIAQLAWAMFPPRLPAIEARSHRLRIENRRSAQTQEERAGSQPKRNSRSRFHGNHHYIQRPVARRARSGKVFYAAAPPSSYRFGLFGKGCRQCPLLPGRHPEPAADWPAPGRSRHSPPD